MTNDNDVLKIVIANGLKLGKIQQYMIDKMHPKSIDHILHVMESFDNDTDKIGRATAFVAGYCRRVEDEEYEQIGKIAQ